MAAEFIAKDNICGQNLLQIVAAGNAIIAEVCRLKDHIPDVFQLKPNVLKKSKYADLIHDFGYFEKVDELAKMFNNDAVSVVVILVNRRRSKKFNENDFLH